MNKRILMLLCVAVLSIGPAFAQFKVSGVVTDENGAPIPFASIVVKGTTIGVAADADGKFAINAPSSKSVLLFSSIGYAGEEVPVGGKATITVALGPDKEALDEVMVVAYGQATKSSFTGSAGKVKGEKIELVPSINPINTLNGTTPGLRMTATGGQPGEDAKITIRGVGSINGSNEPLIVMDGMIYEGSMSNIPSSDIESITVLKDAASTALYGARAANGVIMITTKGGKGEKPIINVKVSHGWVSREQKDYQVMDVKGYMESLWQQIYNDRTLDGADATTAASDASKRVVTDLGYNSSYFPWRGTGITAENIVTDGKYNPAAEYMYADDNDWIAGVERVGHVQDYGISASGKGKYTSYFGSVNYTRNDSYMKNTGFDRYSARANVSFTKNWLKFGLNLAASITDEYGHLSTEGGGLSNPYHVSLKISPIYPIHLHFADGSYVTDSEGRRLYDYGEGYSYLNPSTGVVESIPARADFNKSNIVSYVENRYSNYRRNNINAKPYVEITFLKDFKASFNAALYNSNYNSHSATPYIPEYKGTSTSVTETYSNTQTWAFNQLLSWNHAFGDHHVDALIGHESNSYTYLYETSGKKDQIIIGDNYQFNNYSTLNSTPEGYKNTYNTEGFFARANYDYAGRYFFSASFRRDGSSRFSSTKHWGNFWSVGGSWIISNESWMKSVDWINQLKIRASVGTVGNDNLEQGYYPWMALYELYQNNTEPGYVQSQEKPGNPDLQWEVNTNWDAAVEFSMLGSRLTGSLEYFHRNTSNLLLNVTQAPSSGIHSIPTNSGALLNHGLEFQVAGDIFRTKLVTWNLGINGSVIKNVITDLPIPAYTINNDHNKIQEGHSVYEWWLYQWNGVDPATGLNYFTLGDSFYKTDESGMPTKEYVDGIEQDPDVVTIDGKYYTTAIARSKEDFSGSSLPKIYGGITSNLRVWRFNLDINLYYQLGGKAYDRGYSNLMQQSLLGDNRTIQNRHIDMANSWTAPGQNTNFAILTTNAKEVGSSTYKENTTAARSTRWLASSDMLEINNITLSYECSKKFCNSIKIHGLKIYASADHLAILNARRGMYTNYSFDNYSSNAAFSKPARTISIGINLAL